MTKKFKNLITLLLAFVMTALLAFAVACSDTDSSNSSTGSSDSSATTAVTDKHTLLNGSFEYYTETAKSFPYSTGIKWIRSNAYIVSSAQDAPTSSWASGIIDTSDDAFKTLQDNTKVGDDTLGKYLTVNPKSPVQLGLDGKTITERTDEDGLPENYNDSKVLMLHNRVKDSTAGTAQYFYTSGSSLTLNKGEYGKLSVWVNTVGLSSAMKTDDYGAYVKVVNKVGSTTAAPVIVKNINTDGEWAKVEIYLEASKYSSSSYTVYLGLGLGAENVTAEFVQGFAFFDDVTFQTSDSESELEDNKLTAKNGDEVVDFETANFTAVTAKKAFNAYDTSAVELELVEDDQIDAVETVYAANATNKEFTTLTYTLSHRFNENAYTLGTLTPELNEDAFADSEHFTAASGAVANSVKVDSKSAISLGEDVFTTETSPAFNDTDSFLYFDFTSVQSSVTATFSAKKLEAEERILVTFWAKVKLDSLNAAGLTVNVRDRGVDGTTEERFTDNAIVSAVTATTKENNGWMQYTVIIENTANKVDAFGVEVEDTVPARYYDIEVVFGPTDSKITDKNKFPKGYALVGAFTETKLSEDTASLVTANTTVSLDAEILATKADATDSYTFTARENEINSGVLSQPLSTVKAYNEPVNSGIFNTEYFANDEFKAIEKQVKDNEFVQALAIAEGNGYYTGKTTVTAGTTAKVVVKYVVIGNANAKGYISILDRSNLPEGENVNGYNELTLKTADVDEEHTSNIIGTVAVDASYKYEITATAKNADNKYAWSTATFYVTAGTEDMDISVDVWNGDRLADAEATSANFVVVDSITVTTDDTTTVESIVDAAEEKGVTVTPTEFSFKTKKVNSETGEAITEEVDGVKETQYTVTADVALYATYTTATEYVLYANFLVTNFDTETMVTVESDTDADTSTDEDADHDHEDEATVQNEKVEWLAISSIIIAAVLIVVLAAIIIRFFVKKAKAKNVKTSSYYDRDARDRANDRIRANKAKRDLEAAEEAEEAEDEIEEIEEVEEYNYDEAAEIEEEVTEEAAEEVEEVVEAEEAPAEEAEEAPATEEAVEAPVEAPATEEAPVEATEAPATIAEEEKKDNE